jgi:putative ABC transport system permease protein
MRSSLLALKQIKYQSGQSVVLILLITLLFTVGLISLALIGHFSESFGREASRVDAVLGSKGSPIQLVLSSVHHTDFPTGNISVGKSLNLVKSSPVKAAIPIALGDSYEGFRIVGSIPAFAPLLYSAKLGKGHLATEPFDVVLGMEVAKQTGLTIGETFFSSHGLGHEGHSHENQKLKVVGIWEQTYSPLDQLLYTPLATVWNLHELHHEQDNHETHESELMNHEHENHKTSTSNPIVSSNSFTERVYSKEDWLTHTNSYSYEHDLEREITSWLILFKNPYVAFDFLRKVNRDTEFLVVSPVNEINKLFIWLGLGSKAIHLFLLLLFGIVLLSIGTVLFLLFQKRSYDLAMMRMLGKSRGFITAVWIWEMIFLLTTAILLSFLFTRIGLHFLLTTEVFAFSPPFEFSWEDILLPLCLGIAGVFVVNLLPVWYSWKIPVATTLSRLLVVLLMVLTSYLSANAQTDNEKKQHWKSWEPLSSIRYEIKNYNGEEIYWPVASTRLQKLHKTEITIRGYLILKYADFKHYEFFLSKVPESQCFFCGGSGPETLLMVTAKEEIKPTYKPISLKGILYINTSDPEQPLYWLKEAEFVE